MVKPQLEKENPGMNSYSKKHLSGFLKKPGNAGSNPEHRFNMNSIIPAWLNGRQLICNHQVVGSSPTVGSIPENPESKNSFRTRCSGDVTAAYRSSKPGVRVRGPSRVLSRLKS